MYVIPYPRKWGNWRKFHAYLRHPIISKQTNIKCDEFPAFIAIRFSWKGCVSSHILLYVTFVLQKVWNASYNFLVSMPHYSIMIVIMISTVMTKMMVGMMMMMRNSNEIWGNEGHMKGKCPCEVWCKRKRKAGGGGGGAAGTSEWPPPQRSRSERPTDNSFIETNAGVGCERETATPQCNIACLI